MRHSEGKADGVTFCYEVRARVNVDGGVVGGLSDEEWEQGGDGLGDRTCWLGRWRGDVRG